MMKAVHRHDPSLSPAISQVEGDGPSALRATYFSKEKKE